MFFSTLPAVAEGFQLKKWRGGLEAGKPKSPWLPVAGGPWADAVRHSERLPRLFFTEAGLVELRAMMVNAARRSETVRSCPPGSWH
jgi:hypothetical protein